MNIDIDRQIIKDLGGNNTVAELCEVTPQAVYGWKIKGIPNARRMFLRVVRPEVLQKYEPTT